MKRNSKRSLPTKRKARAKADGKSKAIDAKPVVRKSRRKKSEPRRKKGEGSIIQRANGSYALVVDLGRDPNTKERRRRWISGSSRAEVQRRVADLRAEGGGSIQPRATGTVGSWMDQWIESIEHKLSPTAFVGYRGAWRLHAAAHLESISLEDLDVAHVERMYDALRQDGRSASVVNRVATVMHRAFQVAIRRRMYRKVNPFGLAERPTLRAPETRTLEPAEMARFIEASRGDRYAALWMLLAMGGLRLGEALALRWSDVDLMKRTLSVSRSFIEVSGRIEVGKTKNKTSRRLVTLGADTVAALNARKREAQKEAHGSDLLFPTTLGTPLRRSNLRRSHFKSICEAAGLWPLRIHDLRHSMTSLALLQGVPAKVVAERLGHSTTRLTLDRYSHLIGDLQTTAADEIERSWKATKQGKPSSRASKR